MQIQEISNTTLEILNAKTRIKSIMTVSVPPLFAYISFWFIKKQLVTLHGIALYDTYIDEISARFRLYKIFPQYPDLAFFILKAKAEIRKFQKGAIHPFVCLGYLKYAVLLHEIVSMMFVCF